MPRSDMQDQLDALRAELAELRANTAVIQQGPAEHALVNVPAGHRRRRRALQALVALALAAILPAAVFASHSFTDVPDSNTFHGAIANLKDAGLTSGCSPTTYCPTANVTRGQMAAFLNRGLGRGQTTWGSVVDITPYADVVSGTIKTPGAGFILATVAGMAYTTDSGCPCDITTRFDVDGDQQDSFYFTQTLGSPVTNEHVYAALSNTELFEVVTAGNHTVTVEMSASGSADVKGDAKLTLVYVPFDWQGDAATGFTPAVAKARQNERP